MQDDKPLDFWNNVQRELKDLRAWVERAVILTYAVFAGLAVVGFTMLAEWGFGWFEHTFTGNWRYAALVWTPMLTVGIVWCTQRFFAGAGGSGIPQVMATLDSKVSRDKRSYFVSLRLTFGKIMLSVAGLAAGLSLGREGPSVQVAAGVLHNARHWLRPGRALSEKSLLVAGGAAGIAAAFNAPLAGVIFAIEELMGRFESRAGSVVIMAIVLAGLVSISVFGNYTFFGTIQIPVEVLHWTLFAPALLVVVMCGLGGGLFSRLLLASLTDGLGQFSEWRKQYPLTFAFVIGLIIAEIGLLTGGATFGAGGEEVRSMLAGESQGHYSYSVLKSLATWLTAWTGVPGGIFSPSLSIGAGIGRDVAELFSGQVMQGLPPVLIALGMAGFLAAVTQAPLTSSIIVMEMVDGRSMVLSLMAAALLSSLISSLIARPLYSMLAQHMVARYVFKESVHATNLSKPD